MEDIHSHEARAGQKGPWDPKLQTPESRKALVDYAKQHGIKPAMRHFNCSRNTIRKWLRRFDTEGTAGLRGLPRGRKPRSATAAKPVAPTPQPWAAASAQARPVAHRPAATLPATQPARPMPQALPQPTPRPVGTSSVSSAPQARPLGHTYTPGQPRL
jgi:hypothetical protein